MDTIVKLSKSKEVQVDSTMSGLQQSTSDLSAPISASSLPSGENLIGEGTPGLGALRHGKNS